MQLHQGFIARRSSQTPAGNPRAPIALGEFMPHYDIGPVTVGELGGRVAIKVFDPLAGEETILVFTALYLFIPVVMWLITAAIWWWASSKLEYNTLSKLIGLLSPFLGTAVEAVAK